MKNKILIIGAGLGGLALAQGLAKAGLDAVVFERDEVRQADLRGTEFQFDLWGCTPYLYC